MRLVIEGRPNKLIADELDISVRTVEVHRARVFEKMDVKSAVELANRCASTTPARAEGGAMRVFVSHATEDKPRVLADHRGACRRMCSRGSTFTRSASAPPSTTRSATRSKTATSFSSSPAGSR